MSQKRPALLRGRTFQEVIIGERGKRRVPGHVLRAIGRSLNSFRGGTGNRDDQAKVVVGRFMMASLFVHELLAVGLFIGIMLHRA